VKGRFATPLAAAAVRVLAAGLGLAGAACAASSPPAGDGAPPPDTAVADTAVADTAADVGEAAAPAGPPDGFLPIAPCLAADQYVTAPAAVTTAGVAYTPTCLRVPRGTAVTIEASSVHPLEPGPGGSPGNPIPTQTSPVTVSFPRPGVYPFFCPEHSDVGMRGVVWVTEAP
jgi:plastocyanin